MSGAMFIKTGDRLVPIREEPYDKEDRLQAWLAEYPDLLAGEQMDPQSPRRFMFVAREVGIPSEENAADRWSLDHLFVDQDAVPTLVEVKRSSDTRLRREVVGQMLDYAANASEYLTPSRIAEVYALTCAGMGLDPAARLADFLGRSAEESDFWELVGDNLRTGNVRLVFVADAIPRELRRIILFLDGRMETTEVWGIEVKKYEGDFGGDDIVSFVSRTIGQPKAESKPGRSRTRKWDKESVLAELRGNVGDKEYEVALELVAWAEAHMDRLTFGRGQYNGSMIPVRDTEDAWYSLFCLWTGGLVEMEFGYLSDKPGFSEAVVTEFADRIAAATGIGIPPERVKRFPTFPLSSLIDDSAKSQFLDALDWAIQHIPDGE